LPQVLQREGRCQAAVDRWRVQLRGILRNADDGARLHELPGSQIKSEMSG
jgi:hypothetical protein